MGATAFGFACVWVNRSGMPDEDPDVRAGEDCEGFGEPGET